MVAKILTLLTVVTLAASLPQGALAQAGTNRDKSASNGPRKQLTIILFSGIAGAILGLSTLSFYGRPQDKLNNIAYGFAIGIIVGAGYSAYAVTTAPKDFSRGAVLWEEEDRTRLARAAPGDHPLRTGYTWHF